MPRPVRCARSSDNHCVPTCRRVRAPSAAVVAQQPTAAGVAQQPTAAAPCRSAAAAAAAAGPETRPGSVLLSGASYRSGCLAVDRRKTLVPQPGTNFATSATWMNTATCNKYVDALLEKNVLGETYVTFATMLHAKEKTAADVFGFVRATVACVHMLPAAVRPEQERRAALYDSDESCARRCAGDKLLADQEFREALARYTEAAIVAQPNTERYALALAGRSAALFALNEYQLCSDDVWRALLSGHPAGTLYELYERAGDALYAVRQCDEALKSYLKCLKHVREVAKLPDTEAQVLTERVKSAIQQCRAMAAEAQDDRKQLPLVRKNPVSHLLGGVNEKIPALSQRLEIRPSAVGMPLGVFATSDINPGDVVAIENPYVCGPGPYYNSICHYSGCLKMSIAVIPCPECSLAFYCNEVCLENALTDGHNIECPILYSVHSLPGNSYLNQLALKWFVKECSKMGVQTFCSLINSMGKPTEIGHKIEGLDDDGLFESDNFLSAYCMRTSGTSLDSLFFFHCVAVEILEYLLLIGFEIPECSINTAGASIAHMINVLDNNCRKLYVNNPSIPYDTMKELSYPIAYALYPTIGLFNHSCDPNVMRSGLLSDKTRVLKAIQPISKGSQLFISYGVVFNRDKLEKRLSFCKKNFNFKCTCQPCLEEWPLGECIPCHVTTSNLMDRKMMCTVMAECNEFNKRIQNKNFDEFHRHLNYLYCFNKFMYANVKRPFKLYEECLSMLYLAHIHPSMNDHNLSSFIFKG